MGSPHATSGSILIVSLFALLQGLPSAGRAAEPADAPATIEQVLKSPFDLWGEAALKQPGGPSYEFFEPLLPPMRYCDAPFRHYPITLSAPGAPIKARFVSNGSGVNALARMRNWIGETGLPFTFRVGDDIALFGEKLDQLTGPKYEQGYLPIVQLSYRYGEQVFTQEAFASVDPALSKHGVVLVRFSVAEGPKEKTGKIEAQLEGYSVNKLTKGVLRDEQGKILACAEPEKWHYTPGRGTLIAKLSPGESAVLAIYTEPGEAESSISASEYDAQRKQCIDTWNQLLETGTNFVTPEARVNDAWRATTIGNYMLLLNDQMRYSQGNQYAKLYIGEGGDAVRTMALFGHTDTAKKCIPPLFVYTRKGLEFHQAALKLQMLAHYYFLTRDADFLKSIRVISDKGRKPGWQTELDILLNGREEKSGLFPPEQYAGDITDKVYSLNSNANGWRGLRDMSVVLADIGETELSQKVAASAEQFRTSVMAAIEKSIFRDIKPPFIPLALFGAEKPYEMIVGARLGSYWNIMTKYVLTTGVFPIDHEYADALIDYSQQRGGLCMGMNRNCATADTWWIQPRGINDLYGMRYALALLERDEPDRALVSFYGKLAHGFTRDTYIDGEGASIVPMYEDGRQTYLPPNSAGNASYLQQLRYLLVQDYDTDDDGSADTLRLMFATPRKWLEDGKEIKVERAPTMFGEMSMHVRSKVADGGVTIDLDLPKDVKTTLLRLRLPEGLQVDTAKSGDRALSVDGETLDLSGLSGKVQVTVDVKPK